MNRFPRCASCVLAARDLVRLPTFAATQLVAVAIVLTIAAALSACAAPSATPLPDLQRTSTDGMMTPAQQQQAIAELARKKSADEAAAVKKIEQSR